MNNPFATLGVSPMIQKSLTEMQYQEATPVQSKTIAPFLQGLDLLVEAPTGTGKTSAFGIPTIQKTDVSARYVQSLILCPTRELALQTTAVLRQLAKYSGGIRIATVYGGENIQHQLTALRCQPQIIVATPGRLVDHLTRRTVCLDRISTVVLDEADRMLDMGFRHDLTRILDSTPRERQTALFSATISNDIKAVAREYQRSPAMIRISPGSVSEDAIRQYFAQVQSGCKNAELISILEARQFPLALVFVRTKRRAASLAVTLCKKGICAGALHGNMSQPQRERVMRQYRQGMLHVLVATDVASRGLDVQKIDAVINYDIPEDCDAYTHRIGRTGRADHKGIALTFVDGQEEKKLRQIVGGKNIEMLPVDALYAVM